MEFSLLKVVFVCLFLAFASFNFFLSIQGNPNNVIGVYDVTNLHEVPLYDIQYTPSVFELVAKWQVIQVQGLPPLW